ncbi:cochlin-like [Nematostella vectensis]|uniref:cochlin-like n=1 Tax=Nematostella vectensis TaxID=45351 RepID=UPI00207767F1|nr:cochlin-like [Nematostella vectensis]
MKMSSFLLLAAIISFMLARKAYGVELVEPYNRCYGQVELGFIVDGSRSIEASACGNFKRMLDFTQRIASGFGIASSQTRVGVGLYSTFASVPIPFGKYTSLQETVEGIKKLRYPGEGTRTGRALKLMKTHLFSQSRPKAHKVLIVLTDGTSVDDVKAPAKALRESGVEVFAVGIGEHYRPRELKDIATDTGHVLTAGFRDLMSVERKLRDAVCKSVRKAMMANAYQQGVGACASSPCYGK